VALLSRASNIQWVLTALRTITTDHRNLRRVLVHVPCLSCGPATIVNRASPAHIGHAIGEIGRGQWSEFDHLLAQLWESRSIRPEVLYYKYPDGTDCCCVNSSLPEVTRRGIVDLVKCGDDIIW